MIKPKHLLLILLAISIFAFKNDQPAYLLYNKKGDKIHFKTLVKEASKVDVVFFGELHNNAIAHWLQYELLKRLYQQDSSRLSLGAEMFEADNQLIINEYLSGLISEKKFEAECRLWPNYATDYKPLVSFCKDKQLKLIASNIPRRYASLVFKKGLEELENLSAEAKQFIAPLPIHYNVELKAYKDMLSMQGEHTNPNLPKAQAVKDATMAYFINKNLEKGGRFIHFQGNYHSDNYESIIYYLKRLNPNIKILSISTFSTEDVQNVNKEALNKADISIAVDEDMTSTY